MEEYVQEIQRLKCRMENYCDKEVELCLQTNKTEKLQKRVRELEHKVEKNKDKKVTVKEETVEMRGQYDTMVDENNRLSELVARLQFQVNAVNSQNGQLNTMLEQSDKDVRAAAREMERRNEMYCQ